MNLTIIIRSLIEGTSGQVTRLEYDWPHRLAEHYDPQQTVGQEGPQHINDLTGSHFKQCAC